MAKIETFCLTAHVVHAGPASILATIRELRPDRQWRYDGSMIRPKPCDEITGQYHVVAVSYPLEEPSERRPFS